MTMTTTTTTTKPKSIAAALAACLVALVALVAGSARAGGSDDRVLIYVDDVQPADKALAVDATALTTALCTALAKDKRLDVLCAPDVKQILSFAATASMVGTTGGPGGAVQQRLDHASQVVSATYRKDGGNYVLVVKAGPRAAESQGLSLFSDKPVVALEEKADKQKLLLDRLAAVSTRIAAAVTTPPAAPPPAPIEPKK